MYYCIPNLDFEKYFDNYFNIIDFFHDFILFLFYFIHVKTFFHRIPLTARKDQGSKKVQNLDSVKLSPAIRFLCRQHKGMTH